MNPYEKQIRANKLLKGALVKLRNRARPKIRRGVFVGQEVVMLYFEETAPNGERFEVTSFTPDGARALGEALIALANECAPPPNGAAKVTKDLYIGKDEG